MRTRRQFLESTAKMGLVAALTPLASNSLHASEIAGSAPQNPANGNRKTRPNILLFLPDQWRFDWTSANPHLPIRTPNLDRLARAGVRFTNVAVASPLCAPSRASIASGREYGRTEVASNTYDYPGNRIETFYSMLRKSGYHVLVCGKSDLAKVSHWWGLDGKWRLPWLGFSDGINNAGKQAQLNGYELNNNKPAGPYLAFLNDRGLLEEHLRDLSNRLSHSIGGYGATYPTPLPDDAYCDNWIAGSGLDLLDAAPKDKPWFLQVNFAGPHNPEDITARMEASVRGLSMPAPNGKDQFNSAQNQAIRQNYTAMCENIDRNIGLYVDKLKSLGQLENTLIAFSSDHGDMLGDHGRWDKSVPYHPSACVPLIVAGPGIQQGRMSPALINNFDLTATFLDYAGVPRPKEMDSQSFRPVLEGQSTTHRSVIFSGLGAWRMAWDGEYKAITGFNAKKRRNSANWTIYAWQVQGLDPIIFDLASDPGENSDLYASMPAQGKRLLQTLTDHTTDLENGRRHEKRET